MNVDGELTRDEALRYAAMRGDAPLWALLPTIDRLYLELRQAENKAYNDNCSCHPK